jgi:four helix bundle protein
VAKGDDIQERLIHFAVTIINHCSEIPATQSGKHIAAQLLRCGTSPAPNYGEARGAESTRDFIHKLKIVLKELNETKVWLLILKESRMLHESKVVPVLNECIELSKIIVSSLKTTMRKT